MTVCEFCDTPIPPGYKGRTREGPYCSEPCRQKLYRRSKTRQTIDWAIQQDDFRYLNEIKIKEILSLGYNVTIKRLTIGNLNEEGKLVAL